MKNIIVLMSYSSISYAVNLYYNFINENQDVSFIVFNNKNIEKFLYYINIPKTSVKFYQHSICGNNFIKNKCNFYKILKEIKKVCKSNIYIFNKNECIEIFDLFYRFEKKNLIKINYINFDPIIEYKKQNILRNLFYYTKYKIYTKVPFKISSNKHIVIPEVDKSILRKYYTSKMNFKFNYFNELIKGTSGKVLIAEVDLIKIGICKEAFISTNNEIYNILINYFQEVTVKPHPMFNYIHFEGDRNKIKIKEEYIPLEALLNDEDIEIVIGIMTTALINASRIGKKVISTLEFYELEQKDDIKEWLMKESYGRILFPSTIAEFKNLLGVGNNDK